MFASVYKGIETLVPTTLFVLKSAGILATAPLSLVNDTHILNGNN